MVETARRVQGPLITFPSVTLVMHHWCGQLANTGLCMLKLHHILSSKVLLWLNNENSDLVWKTFHVKHSKTVYGGASYAKSLAINATKNTLNCLFDVVLVFEPVCGQYLDQSSSHRAHQVFDYWPCVHLLKINILFAHWSLQPCLA